jgi:ATP-binding cassette, subfamily B, bacterial PglK
MISNFEYMRINLLKILVASYRMLTPKERRLGFIVSAFSFVGGVADMVAVVAVYPLISVLVEPSLINTNSHIRKIWEFFGEASQATFILELALLSGLAVIIGSILNLFSQVKANQFAAACQERLSFDLMEAMIKAPYVWHLRQNPALLGNIFENHIIIWGRDVIRRICALAGQVATILLPIFAIIGWSPVFGMLTPIAALLFQTFIMRVIKLRTKKLGMHRKQSEQWLLIYLSEVFQGIKDVKLSPHKYYFLKSFSARYHTYCQNFSAGNSWNLIPIHITTIVGQLGILVIGVALFLSGIRGGDLASIMAIVVFAASRVFPTMIRVGAFIGSLSDSSAWVEVLSKIHADLEKSLYDTRFSKKISGQLVWKEILLKDISFAYPDSKKMALDVVSLKIKRGGSYAIAGASGSGKSTLADLIIGLLEPSAGSIEVDGVKISSQFLPTWQAKIGYVPQSPIILDASLLENIAFGVGKGDIDEEMVYKSIEIANLNDVLQDLPDGLDTNLGNRGILLSGGQRQRVAIARAFYGNPDILVFDEASSALDAISESQIRESLLSLHGKVTLITIAHRLSTIASSDCIYLLSKGKLVAQGNYSFFKKNNKLFADLFLRD